MRKELRMTRVLFNTKAPTCGRCIYSDMIVALDGWFVKCANPDSDHYNHVMHKYHRCGDKVEKRKEGKE